MIPLSSRCCCVSSIITPFSWVDWFWRRRRKHKREVLKLLRGQILCGRHKAERIDFAFNRGRGLSLQRAMAWVDPSHNTSEDQRTGSNGGECGLAHLVLSFVWCEPTTGDPTGLEYRADVARHRFGIVCIALAEILLYSRASGRGSVRTWATAQS